MIRRWNCSIEHLQQPGESLQKLCRYFHYRRQTPKHSGFGNSSAKVELSARKRRIVAELFPVYRLFASERAYDPRGHFG